MKNAIALCAGITVLTFLAPASRSDVIPPAALFWDFNTATSAVTSSSGQHQMDMTMYDRDKKVATMLGGATSGVSGSPVDHALDLTSATGMGSGSGGVGGGAKGGNLITALGGMESATSVTFAGWFHVSEPIGGNAQLFNQTNGDNDGFRISSNTAGSLSVDIVGTAGRKKGAATSGGIFNEVNEWVFFAVTYDNSGPAGSLKFYKGTLETGVYLADSMTLNIGNFKPGAYPLTIGNYTAAPEGSYGNAYPFQGLLDNMGVWISATDGSGALTVEQLEALRVSQIPEPSTLALLAAVAGIAIGAKRLQQR